MRAGKWRREGVFRRGFGDQLCERGAVTGAFDSDGLVRIGNLLGLGNL